MDEEQEEAAAFSITNAQCNAVGERALEAEK